MKTVNPNQLLWSRLLTTALLGGLFGLLLILLPTDLLMKVIFVVFGVITILSALPSLVIGLSFQNERMGRFSLISALISIAMGIVLIFWHNNILMIVLGIYFLVLPLLEILLAKDRMRQFKSALPKLIIGVVLLVLGPAKALDIVFDVVGWSILALTVLSMVITTDSFLNYRKKLSQMTGSRTFVDHDGDGTVDAVYMDREKK